MNNIKTLKIGEVFPINEKLAGVVPMASPREQEALTINIMENGLNEPVVLWQNEIVDGRCRQLACTQAGVAVRAVSLNNELSEEAVVKWVKAANTRRNLTMAQKIMTASQESLKEGSGTLTDIAKSWGISRRILTHANYISKARPDFIEPLHNGLTVPIVDKKGKHTKTNKITAIYNFIKREEEDVTATDTNSWAVDLYIDTQAGKDYFFDFIRKTNANDVRLYEPIAFWINERFKSEETEAHELTV